MANPVGPPTPFLYQSSMKTEARDKFWELHGKFSELAQTKHESGVADKVLEHVRKYDYAKAREAADQLVDGELRELGLRLIQENTSNFSTIEEDFPWG